MHQDLYAVLELGPAASQQEIRRAYRRLLRSHHPDLQPRNQAEDVRGRVAGELQLIMHAYTVLSQPAHRAEYDRMRHMAQRRGQNTADFVGHGQKIPVRVRPRPTVSHEHGTAYTWSHYRNDTLREVLAFLDRYFH